MLNVWEYRGPSLEKELYASPIWRSIKQEDTYEKD